MNTKKRRMHLHAHARNRAKERFGVHINIGSAAGLRYADASHSGKEARRQKTEFSANSGGFNNYLGHMRTLGFIDYPTKGHVKCAEWMFL